MSRFASLFTGAAPETSPGKPGENAPAKKKYRLLFVDDEPNVLSALKRVFRQENYEIETAASGNEALAILYARPVQLVISDFMMPGMNGAELLKRVKAAHPDTLRIMLTGHADTGAVMGAINEGAVYKFILKPWNDDDLRVTVALALEQYDLVQKNRALQQDNAQKSKKINTLSKLVATSRSQIPQLLHKHRLLNDAQLQELYKLHQSQKEPMLKLILERGWVEEKALRDLLRKELLVEEVSLDEFEVEPALADLLPHSFCARYWVLPLKIEERRLLLAVADPLDLGLLDDLRFATGFTIQPVVASVSAIRAKVEAVYRDKEMEFSELESLTSNADPYESIEVVIEEEDALDIRELLTQTEEPPAIRLVNAIVLEAIRLGVSDIHIQPRTKNVAVRYRLDGVLADKILIPNHLHNPLVSRIKVMAEMDIVERRRPQDGRITVKTPLRIVDLRISTLPTLNGEKVVMRVLDRNSKVYAIEQLGLSEDNHRKIMRMIARPQGIILATGPTGSGKTTTLYALLQYSATPMKNYVTIEDPVEFYMDMAGQVSVKEKINLTFPLVLRAILRQDPDVILLGEIRDLETAEVAFHAALTGHVVFSTLHTNSAVATVARLFDLGLKPYVVASALEGIIAQRLVRKICTQCREPGAPDPAVLEQLGPLFEGLPLSLLRGKGCPSCNNSGYKGRVGLYEVLTLDGQTRNLISSGASILEINHYICTAGGYRTMLHDAFDKVAASLTTCEEILRVLGPQDSPCSPPAANPIRINE